MPRQRCSNFFFIRQPGENALAFFFWVRRHAIVKIVCFVLAMLKCKTFHSGPAHLLT
jgi:hypothetical protein